MENIKIKATDGLELSCLYSKVDNPKKIIQMIHGMVEHKERYIPLIERLNKEGYTVIISDNRGHGESVNSEYPLGHMGKSYELLVADQYEITKFVKEDNPNVGLYIFSHSMGTLISRSYMAVHDDEIEKLILSGTVCYIGIAWLGVFTAWFDSLFAKKGHSKLLYAFSNNMSFGHDHSWLSYNEENIKAYDADPLCNILFTNASNYSLFSMTNDLHYMKRYMFKNPDLKIMSISGADDRTTGGKKGLKDIKKTLEDIGYKDVIIKEYDHMKHEILNENDNECVYNDIIEFFNN